MRATPLLFALLLTACSGSEPKGAHGDPAAATPAEAPVDAGHTQHKPDDTGAHGDHATTKHRFDDVEKWTSVFDDPERDAWQMPAELVGALRIAPGSTVADIGAGTGYFNPHLAAAVGSGGTVIAVDVEQSLVDHMAQRATKEGTPQVEARLGGFSDPKLRAREADLVLLVDTYHHIDSRKDYFGRLKSAMKPGGRLVVVDFFKNKDIPVGPPPDHRIAANQVRDELAEAGWSEATPIELLPYQYVLVFGAE